MIPSDPLLFVAAVDQCSRLSKLEVRVGGEAGALLRGHVPEARVEAEDACFKVPH